MTRERIKSFLPIFAEVLAEEVIGGELDGLLGGHQGQVDGGA